MNISNKFGERLKELRSTYNLNQSSFAEQIGVKQSTLSAYESGNLTPSADVLVNIAMEFHVSLDWLFGLSDNQFILSTVGDVAKFLFDLDELSDLRFEIDVEEPLLGNGLPEGRHLCAMVKFYRNDPNHPLNEIMFDFLSEYKETRRDFETYFISKKIYDLWKDYAVNKHSKCTLLKKEYKPLSEPQRISLRDSLLLEEALRSKETNIR